MARSRVARPPLIQALIGMLMNGGLGGGGAAQAGAPAGGLGGLLEQFQRSGLGDVGLVLGLDRPEPAGLGRADRPGARPGRAGPARARSAGMDSGAAGGALAQILPRWSTR